MSILYNTLQHTSGLEVNIKKIIVHPEYNSRTIDNDIAILHLSTPLNLGQKNAGTVCLPAQGNDFGDGEDAEISGWGTTQEGGSLPTDLQTVTVPGVSRQRCRQAYGESEITDNMVCAGLLDQGGKDSCQVSIFNMHTICT